MSAIADRYRARAADFALTIAAVPDDRWARPSPCPEWSAIDVVDHVVDAEGRFVGFIDRAFVDVPPVADGPGAAWAAASAQMQAYLDDPATAQMEFEGFLGTSTFEASVDRFVTFDLVLHRWDLARAAGVDDTMNEAEVEYLLANKDALFPPEMMRMPTVFGPEIEVGPNARPQDRVVAFFGRDPQAGIPT